MFMKMMSSIDTGRNELCWCGSGRKYMQCHGGVEARLKQFKRRGYQVPTRRRLVATAKQSITEGLKEVKPWVCLGNIGAAINSYVRKQGFRVVRDVGGHGVGLEFHEEPFVSYVTRKNTGMILAPGMVFTIEPMINVGTDEVVLDAENGWTIYTADGKSSAQWEVTVLVTANGYEVLTY